MQQCLPLAVLKQQLLRRNDAAFLRLLQQCLPLAVLKRFKSVKIGHIDQLVATVPTACGIETSIVRSVWIYLIQTLQQRLPLAVCDEGCEVAEEQSDDETRTSLVPD